MIHLPRDWSTNPTPIGLYVTDGSGTGVSGLTYQTSGLVLEYSTSDGNAWTTIAKAGGTLGTYVSGGFVAGSTTGGAYWLGLPVAALSEGGRCLVRWTYNGVSRAGEVRADLAPSTLTAAKATSIGTDSPGVTTLTQRIPAVIGMLNGYVLVDVRYTNGVPTLPATGTPIGEVANTIATTLNASPAQQTLQADAAKAGALADRNPAALAKPGDAMTLTAAYDRAKTAATPQEVSPTIAFNPTINPPAVTVNPTPVTVNPTTLDAGERAAIASAVWLKTGRTVDSVTGGVQLSSAAILGGGGSLFLAGGYTAPDNAGIQAARVAAEAVNNRLPAEPASKQDVEQGNGDEGGFAQAITVRAADTSAAIERAVVRYAAAGVTHDEKQTDASGVATVAVFAGTYTRTVSAAGFQASVASVDVAADGAVSIALIRITSTGNPTNAAPGLAN